MKKLFLNMTILFSCICCFAKTNLHSTLHHVEKQITHTKQLLVKDQYKKMTLEKNLKTYEINIGNLSKESHDTEKKLNRKISELKILKNKHSELNKIAETQQKKLNTFLSHFYINRKLNSPHPENRMDVYEHYLSKKYAGQIKEIKNTMQTLKTNQRQISEDTVALTILRDQLKKEQQLLDHQKTLRKTTLNSLSGKIKNERDKLAALNSNKSKLEKVIKNLKNTKAYTAKYFTSHKGKMRWPVKGKMIVHFGDQIAHSNIHSNGVEISAPLNTPVKAIAPGKIVFDDWMPGFGRLLIIDHGKGYMSIYGHNNIIEKHLGDHIAAGEVIAKVGSSGGIIKHELYFSVRSNGKPLDPARWCC